LKTTDLWFQYYEDILEIYMIDIQKTSQNILEMFWVY